MKIASWFRRSVAAATVVAFDHRALAARSASRNDRIFKRDGHRSSGRAGCSCTRDGLQPVRKDFGDDRFRGSLCLRLAESR